MFYHIILGYHLESRVVSAWNFPAQQMTNEASKQKNTFIDVNELI